MKLNRIFVIFLFGFLFSSSLIADENKNLFDSATVNYSKNNFERTLLFYDSILKNGMESHELYFNIGNAYYKLDKIGLAILNYEKAKKIKPEDEDIIENLKIANSKIDDKIDQAPQLFLTEWKNGIIDIMSEKKWSFFCILSLIFSLLFYAFFYVSANPNFKKFNFYFGSLLLIVSLATFFIAKNKYYQTITSKEAIITAPSCTINSSPNTKGTKLFLLHEGTKVTLLETQDNWTEIKIANGNVGWVQTNSIASI